MIARQTPISTKPFAPFRAHEGGIKSVRWLNEYSEKFLTHADGYLNGGRTTRRRVREVGEAAEAITGASGLADAVEDYASRGWFSFSTPIWTNFGNARGLPISCYGTHIGDSMDSILRAHAEVGMQTKLGGGTSAGFGSLRGRGAEITGNGKSSGSVHFMQLFETLINVASQGSTRRGNFAAYLPIDHPDVEEFLQIRTEGSKLQDISFGICVPNAWMESMIAGDASKRKLWARVLERRRDSGYPYVFFPDNADLGAPDVYRDKGMKIKQSNLCNEINLPSSEEESFVCDLLSMNDLYYHEWKNTDAVRVATYLLDAVMTEFIHKAEGIPFMERSVRFAKRHRALGIGRLGWHSFLQSEMLPFESIAASAYNEMISRSIKEQAYAASAELAERYGEPELLRGYGRRNTTLIAIAPTKSSSFILGQASEGIEPHRSNYYIKDLAKGKYTIRNPHLQKLLAEKGCDTEAVWAAILADGGSVRNLDVLTDDEKAVFKTFAEISPRAVIKQAIGRQKHIDQGQSLNLMIHPSVPVKDVNALMIDGWRGGLKGYYYQISVNAAQEFARDVLSCASCSA